MIGQTAEARWSEIGVIEADCLPCHCPEYNFKKRNDHLAALNFRWAAPEGATPGIDHGSAKRLPFTVVTQTNTTNAFSAGGQRANVLRDGNHFEFHNTTGATSLSSVLRVATDGEAG